MESILDAGLYAWIAVGVGIRRQCVIDAYVFVFVATLGYGSTYGDR